MIPEKIEKPLFFHSFLIAALLFAVLFYSGIVKMTDKHPYTALISLSDTKKIEAVVCAAPVKSASGRFYIAECALRSVFGEINHHESRSSASGRITVFVPAQIAESLFPGKLCKNPVYLDAGETVLFTGSAGEGGTFFADDVQCKGYFGAFGAVNAMRAACRLQFRRLLYSWREAGGLLLALITGCREYLEVRTGEAFRGAGVSHILAISGMHLVFISGNIALVLYTLAGKRFKLLLLLAVQFLFVWFAGISPSLFRALLCSMLSIMSAFCYKKIRHRLDFLALAFLLHAIIFPSHLFQISFVFSYAACAGIFAFADLFEQKMTAICPPALSANIALSASAQTFTLPISALVFRSLVPFALFASVALSPLVSVFMIVGVIGIMLCLMLPMLSPFFGVIIGALYKTIFFTATFFSGLPAIHF